MEFRIFHSHPANFVPIHTPSPPAGIASPESGTPPAILHHSSSNQPGQDGLDSLCSVHSRDNREYFDQFLNLEEHENQNQPGQHKDAEVVLCLAEDSQHCYQDMHHQLYCQMVLAAGKAQRYYIECLVAHLCYIQHHLALYRLQHPHSQQNMYYSGRVDLADCIDFEYFRDDFEKKLCFNSNGQGWQVFQMHSKFPFLMIIIPIQNQD